MGSGWSSGLQVRFIMSIDNYHESSNQFDYHFDNVLHDLRTHLSTTHMIRSEKIVILLVVIQINTIVSQKVTARYF